MLQIVLEYDSKIALTNRYCSKVTGRVAYFEILLNTKREREQYKYGEHQTDTLKWSRKSRC